MLLRSLGRCLRHRIEFRHGDQNDLGQLIESDIELRAVCADRRPLERLVRESRHDRAGSIRSNAIEVAALCGPHRGLERLTTEHVLDDPLHDLEDELRLPIQGVELGELRRCDQLVLRKDIDDDQGRVTRGVARSPTQLPNPQQVREARIDLADALLGSRNHPLDRPQEIGGLCSDPAREGSVASRQGFGEGGVGLATCLHPALVMLRDAPQIQRALIRQAGSDQLACAGHRLIDDLAACRHVRKVGGGICGLKRQGGGRGTALVAQAVHAAGQDRVE